MITIDPIELYLRGSSCGLGGSGVPVGSNDGPFVVPRLTAVGLKKGQSWCLADIMYTGKKMLADQWPLPMVGGCAYFAELAEQKKIVFETPQRGDIGLIWEYVKGENVWRFAHAVICVAPAPSPAWTTHEGNTSGAGSREGW